MEYLPLFVDLKNRPVLVIGGGSVAARKIQMLLRVRAKITLIASSICSELKAMVLIHNNIIWINKNFEPVMLDEVILVIVATNDYELNDSIYKHAEKRHVLINTVDDKNKCSCIFPAIINRDPIIVGISSCGKAPILIRILREKLESLLPKSLGCIAKFSGTWRSYVKKRIVDTVLRRRFWEKIFYDDHIATFLEQGRFEEANQSFKHTLDNIGKCNNKKGNVTLVGAGPGDVGLLTIKGLQVMQQADVVLYDYLVSTEVLDLARRDANKICVGKHVGVHSISQKKINELIVQLVKKGNKVVRLKGGDPFIFGRGGEELQIVAELGIPFQVVPGVTAGVGVTAYAGIPLTHRKYAHSITFITGHNVNNDNYQLDWNALSNAQQTLVIYMGKLQAKNISDNLIVHGLSMHTPVAIISRGTYRDQKIFIGTLIELEKLAQMADSPALLVVGNVVLLHKKINWFGQKSLDYRIINSIIHLM